MIADFNEFINLIMDLPNFNDIKVEISDQSVDDTNNTRKCVTLLSEKGEEFESLAKSKTLYEHDPSSIFDWD